MPKLMNQADTVVQQTVSNFGFSAKRPEELKGSEYTLVDLEVDTSISLTGYETDLKKMLEAVVDALMGCPYSEAILLRVGIFSSDVNELHGFLPVKEIDKSSYNFAIAGNTALYDATLIGVEAIDKYAESLYSLDYTVSGLRILVTDGEENSSMKARSAGAIKNAITKVKLKEKLHEFRGILIGVGDENRVRGYLDAFKKDAGFDQFEWAGNATPDVIADIGGFISRSVSSSSQALATGGQSQNLSFH